MKFSPKHFGANGRWRLVGPNGPVSLMSHPAHPKMFFNSLYIMGGGYCISLVSSFMPGPFTFLRNAEWPNRIQCRLFHPKHVKRPSACSCTCPVCEYIDVMS